MQIKDYYCIIKKIMSLSAGTIYASKINKADGDGQQIHYMHKISSSFGGVALDKVKVSILP